MTARCLTHEHRIMEAAMVHFGRSSTVLHLQCAAGADAHGFIMLAQGQTFIVADWRVKHDGEIGFSDESVGSELDSAEDYRDRVRRSSFIAREEFAELVPEEGDEPIAIDVEDGIAGMVDTVGERRRITVRNARGDEIAVVSGAMAPLEVFEQEGARIARFGISHEGMEATVRFPLDPHTLCMCMPDGTIAGELPNGSSWVLTSTSEAGS
jgi:hypothetical protein